MIINVKDIVLSARILVSLPIAWLVPERYWPVIGRVIAYATLVLPINRRRRNVKRIALMFASSDDKAKNRQVLIDSLVERQNNLFNILRAHRPIGWQPMIRIEGEKYIHRALAQGRGVILWVTPVVHSIMTKKGLSDTGFAVHHLSRPLHGFSDTRFGVSVMNPIVTSVENRYLAQRVVIALDECSGARALEILREVIADNGIVSIVVGDQARKTEDIPFLGGCVRIATGPIHLARTTGAALLPVFTCHDDSSVFHVNVEGELHESDTAAGSTVYRNLAEAYFRRLEPYVISFPSQWDGDIRPITS